MTIPLENILSIDIDDYFKHYAVPRNDYVLKGVKSLIENGIEMRGDPLQRLANKVTLNAIAVVNYEPEFRVGVGGDIGNAHYTLVQRGIALIPKKKGLNY